MKVFILLYYILLKIILWTEKVLMIYFQKIKKKKVILIIFLKKFKKKETLIKINDKSKSVSNSLLIFKDLKKKN